MKALILADRCTWERDELIRRAEAADCVISLGDLFWGDLAALEGMRKPKMGVYGNHCYPDYLADLGFENLHLRTATFGGLIFGGFQGCVRYKEGDAVMHTQEEAQKLLVDFPRVDVMVCHAPPLGVHDERDSISHVGFLALLGYCLKHNPKYLLHGHTYPQTVTETDTGNFTTTQLGETNVIYVQGLQTIDL